MFFKQGRKLFILIIVLLLLFISNEYLVKNFLQNWLYGFGRKTSLFSQDKLLLSSKLSRSFLNFSSVAEENEELHRQNDLLLEGLASVERLQRENQNLRDQLAVGKREAANLIMARIFSLNRGRLASTLLIDKGKQDGVGKSMAVVKGGNVLVGTVAEAFENSSLVILLDDPRSKVSVKIGKSGVLAAAGGFLAEKSAGGGGLIALELITGKEIVQERDLVVTSGLDGLPESLTVARIVKIGQSAGGLFRSVRAELIFDPIVQPDLFVISR